MDEESVLVVVIAIPPSAIPPRPFTSKSYIESVSCVYPLKSISSNGALNGTAPVGGKM